MHKIYHQAVISSNSNIFRNYSPGVFNFIACTGQSTGNADGGSNGNKGKYGGLKRADGSQ